LKCCNVVINRGISQEGSGLALLIAQSAKVEQAITEKIRSRSNDGKSCDQVLLQVPVSREHSAARPSGSPPLAERFGIAMFPKYEHTDPLVRQFQDASLPASERMSALVQLEEVDPEQMYPVAISALIAGVSDPHLAAALLRTAEWAPATVFDRNSSTAGQLAWALVKTIERIAKEDVEDQEQCLAAGYRAFSLVAPPHVATELRNHIHEEQQSRSQMAFNAICVIFTRSDPSKVEGIAALRERVDRYVTAGKVGQIKDPTAFGHYMTAMCATAVLGGAQLEPVVKELTAQLDDWRGQYLVARLTKLLDVIGQSDMRHGERAQQIELLLAAHTGSPIDKGDASIFHKQ
jgi:hypothetical protein